MKQVDIDHPAIKEMISRRSDGYPSYVAGVRAFLTEGGKPPEGTIAYKGYLDAHDLVQYLSGVLADLRAGESEDGMITEWLKSYRGEHRSRDQKLVELREVTENLKVRHNRSLRI